MDDKLKDILSILFEVDKSEITDTFSSDDTDYWDSITHMNMVVAIEEEFDIEFDDEEILELLNFSLIKNIVNSKIV
tara:strand:+ start:5295 stop:5522 length:228 start_codon:yes stop_codon:yes gene_type:complete